jgi:protein-tyrosine-phosphatase
MLPDHDFASAGTYAFPGNSATSDSILVAKEFGVDLASHRAQPLTAQVIQDADLVFGAEKEHVDAILALDPAAPVSLLAANGAEIADPYGASPDVYRIVFGQIRDALTARFDQGISAASPPPA